MNAAVAQERWQGQVIDDKFPLLEWLGGSANTAVFSTHLPDGNPQPAAIKLVRSESTNPVVQLSRWKETAALSSPSLLRIFAFGQCVMAGAHWLYCVMEFAEENLDQVLPVRPLSAEEVGELLPPLLESLAFLHARGLVHSRIRPTNVFAVNNQLKLAPDNVHAAAQNGLKAGQLNAYDPPEIECGTISGAADVWSLGMTLATAFNQRPLSWSRSGQLGPAIPKSIPAPYRLIATECLRISPNERCPLERIKELLSQQSAQAAPLGREQPKGNKKNINKRKMTGPMLAVVSIAIVGLALLIRHSTEQQLSQNPPAKEQPATSAASSARQAQASTGTSRVATDPARSNVRTASSRKGPSSAAVASVVPKAAGSGVVEQVLPQVPRSARETIHGKVHVKVRVSVDANGNVSSATLTSPGPSKYFARLALEASQKWKFQPAASQSGTGEWMLEYKFGRSSTEVVPSPIH